MEVRINSSKIVQQLTQTKAYIKGRKYANTEECIFIKTLLRYLDNRIIKPKILLGNIQTELENKLRKLSG